MAVGDYRCKWCNWPLTMIDGPGYGVHVCRRCDTAPCVAPGSKLRAGPITLGGNDVNGFFAAPPGWQT